MTTVHHTPPPGATPFAIYEDPEDQEPPSPSEMFEADISFNSELSLPAPDQAITSIELVQDNHEEPEPYKSSYTSRPSNISSSQLRRISGVTTTSFVSSLPSEVSIASKPIVPANYGDDSRYTPRKERPPFRNPSSVRAMQMSSPPPLTAYEASRERTKGSYKLATPSRSGRSETSGSGSRRSMSHKGSHHRESQIHQSPQPAQTPQQHLPLVLLHVTILPMQIPYSHDLMAKVMPHWLVENYRLLEEKLQDIILMRRGLLIPHPNDEYELLEERILESLELKTPRLLKCGHFVAPDDDEGDDQEDENDDDEQRSITDDSTGRGSRMSGGTITEEDDCEWKHTSLSTETESICMDCHRQLKKPRAGVGSGKKRWDLKIYAANGLMRAGAWGAAWSEMERCDVEISPWIPDDVRKALDKKVEEQQEAVQRKQLYAAEIQRRVEEDAARQRQLAIESAEKKRIEEEELKKQVEANAALLKRRFEEQAAEKERLEETLNDKIEAAKEAIRMEFETQSLAESNCVAERLRAMEEALKEHQQRATIAPEPSPVRNMSRDRFQGRHRSTSRRPPNMEVPLGTLLKNYLVLQLRDQRNFVILLLGGLIVYMSMNMDPAWKQQLLSSGPFNMPPIDTLPDPEVSSIFVTTTATSVATVTVTQLDTSSIVPTDAASASIRTSQDDGFEEPTSPVSTTPVSAIVEEPLGLSMSTSAAIALESDEVTNMPSIDDITDPEESSSASTEITDEDVSETLPNIVEFDISPSASSLNKDSASVTDADTEELVDAAMLMESSEATTDATVQIEESVSIKPSLDLDFENVEESSQLLENDHEKDEL